MSRRADVVGELLADHRTVTELLTRIETAGPGSRGAVPRAPVAGADGTGVGADGTGTGTEGSGPGEVVNLVEQLSELLQSHCAAEEDHLFPAVHDHVPDGGALVFTSLADHLAIGQYLTDLHGLAPGDAAFGPLLDGLAAAVRTHLREEEERLFPAVRESLSAADLAALGELVRQAREHPPTTPAADAAEAGGTAGPPETAGTAGTAETAETPEARPAEG